METPSATEFGELARATRQFVRDHLVALRSAAAKGPEAAEALVEALEEGIDAALPASLDRLDRGLSQDRPRLAPGPAPREDLRAVLEEVRLASADAEAAYLVALANARKRRSELSGALFSLRGAVRGAFTLAPAPEVASRSRLQTLERLWTTTSRTEAVADALVAALETWASRAADLLGARDRSGPLAADPREDLSRARSALLVPAPDAAARALGLALADAVALKVGAGTRTSLGGGLEAFEASGHVLPAARADLLDLEARLLEPGLDEAVAWRLLATVEWIVEAILTAPRPGNARFK